MTIGPSVSAVVGDITLMETDAIVNAASTDLLMREGVAEAIKHAGGEEIERDARARGPIGPGCAIATRPGRLPFRAIIHAVVLGYDEQGRVIPPTRETIHDATRAALEEADNLGLESIAFPALGTIVGGFDIAEAAEVMVEAVTSYQSRPDAHVRKVVFVLSNENARLTFEEAIDQGGFVP